MNVLPIVVLLTVGHWQFVQLDPVPGLRAPAYWHADVWVWVPPEDCKTWPDGMEWAGGVVYDHHGCKYPKLNGECEGEGIPADCSTRPPELPPLFDPRELGMNRSGMVG